MNNIPYKFYDQEKSGVHRSKLSALYCHIIDKCPHLSAAGIMTIGAYGFDYSTGPNPDLIALMECHEELCTDLQLDRDAVHVSMGMSDDFDRAVSDIRTHFAHAHRKILFKFPILCIVL